MKTKEEIYEAWVKKDSHREAFMAGWNAAVNVSITALQNSYIIDESEDFVAVAIQNIRSATK